MYARTCKNKKLTFDFAEGLVDDNLLVVDRETNSVWSQLDSQAISGPMKGTPMSVIPALQTTWRFWKKQHPATRVMVVQGQVGRPYLYRNRQPGIKRPTQRPTSHDTTSLGLGISIDGESMFLPFLQLADSTIPLRLKIGQHDIVIHYQPSALTAWALDTQGNLLPTVLAYQKGWLSFNPQSTIFKAQSAHP